MSEKLADEIFVILQESDEGENFLVAFDDPTHAACWNDIVEVTVYKKAGTRLVSNSTSVSPAPSVN